MTINQGEFTRVNSGSFVDYHAVTLLYFGHRGDRWVTTIDRSYMFVPEELGRHKLRTRYVYAVKHDSDGRITKFKARLVVLGYGKIWRLENKDTYAPTTSEATIKFNLANAAKKGYKSVLVDYHEAYLHGLMDRVVYLSRILDLEVPNGKMILLHKSPYGTKQAGNVWHAEWEASMIKIGFQQSKYDPCLFIRNDKRGVCFAIAWVGDVISTHDLPGKELDQIIKEIQKPGFVLSSMDNPEEYYRGIKIDFDGRGKAKMSQKTYLEKILKTAEMDGDGGMNPKKVNSPMNNAELPYKKDHPGLEPPEGGVKGEKMQEFPYRNALGSLTHAARWTRPGIKYCAAQVESYPYRATMGSLAPAA